MLKIRYVLIVLVMLLSPVTHTTAQADVRFNISIFPELVVVSGYPVYYAPHLDANYFFYDGLYWIYYDDDWYSSYWYNGPWWLVYREDVPVYILRIPVRYYRHPPFYFYGWYRDAPPRWDDHWGHDWSQHRRGWDRWDRRSVPPPAPPPVYQRQYSGDRYPRQVEQQYELHQKNYRYQPHDPVVRQRYQEQVAPRLPAQQERRRGPDDRGDARQQGNQRFESPQRRDDDMRRSAPSSPPQGRPEVQDQRRQQQPGPDQRSDQRGRQMRIEPAQQATPGQRDIPPAATRSQSPQTGGMSIERSDTPSSQEGRREGQDRKQQTQQGIDKREQPQARSQESREQPREQPREQQRDRGDRNEQQWGQEQGRGLDRQNDRRDDRRGDSRDDNRWNN
ncbi:MAG TPA: hypothetical protein VK967_08195 [Methylotenera sp.]|nr:hypothetical protein [Methylotenera sp.]